MAEKLITHHRAKVAAHMERRKEAMEQREAQRALNEQKAQELADKVIHEREQETAAGSKQPQASPTGARRGGLRDRLEEAMDRERARKTDDRDADKERE